MKKPRVKICCISSKREAELAISYGASALGFVGPMPSGSGVIPDTLISDIVKTIPSSVNTFLLTSETTVEGIVSHHRKVKTSTVQIVDALEDSAYRKLRVALPGINLVQVIHVIDENSVIEAIEISENVDALLLDSGNPNLPIKKLGGTGKVHDWSLSRKIKDSVKCPVYLAGGINSYNVVQALSVVEPFGVDLCSSVRTGNKLDEKKLKAFFSAVEKFNYSS